MTRINSRLPAQCQDGTATQPSRQRDGRITAAAPPSRTPALLQEGHTQSGRDPDVPLHELLGRPLPTGSYWDDHRYVGEATLDAENRLLVSLVAKDGQWSIRLRTYRRSERGEIGRAHV